jgi:hypothetical protein
MALVFRAVNINEISCLCESFFFLLSLSLSVSFRSYFSFQFAIRYDCLFVLLHYCCQSSLCASTIPEKQLKVFFFCHLFKIV